MTPGRFITLEGGEGVGKSTQVGLLATALEAAGLPVLPVLRTREPGGSAGAEAIRALLLEGGADRWTPPAEALLFAAARADHVARTIRPALESGTWVLCDRFLDSSLAYQSGADGIDADAIRALHRVGSGGLMPDRTLVLALPTRDGTARALARDGEGSDRFGQRDAAYHDRVAASFAALAAADPQRMRVVDGSGSPGAVTERLLDALADLLP